MLVTDATLASTLAEQVHGHRGISYDRPVVIECDDLRTITLRIEPDYEVNPFRDYDCYGTLHETHVRWTGREQRPHGVDGAGSRMQARDGMWWWQPPADVKPYPEALAALRERVRRFVSEQWSFVGIVLTLTDASGVERGHASLWSVEDDLSLGELTEIISDLLSEVLT